MRHFDYPCSAPPSPLKTINWTDFFMRTLHEKNADAIAVTAKEIQEFALNREAYTKK